MFWTKYFCPGHSAAATEPKNLKHALKILYYSSVVQHFYWPKLNETSRNSTYSSFDITQVEKVEIMNNENFTCGTFEGMRAGDA